MTANEKKYYDLVRAELKEELLPQEYRDKKVNSNFYGHCHHATIALYNLLGGKESGYKVRKAIDELNITHYWLETKDGEIIDPTVEQYLDLGRNLPYENKKDNKASYRKTTSAIKIINKLSV